MDLMPYNRFYLGRNSTVEDFSTINNGVGDVVIGDNTRIGISNILIGPVTIGNEVRMGQHIILSGLNHGYQNVTAPPRMQEVTISEIKVEDEAWIGANSAVIAGVTIGKHAVIAAGSVVTKDIPPYSVAVGNPARVIKNTTLILKYGKKLNLKFLLIIKKLTENNNMLTIKILFWVFLFIVFYAYIGYGILLFVIIKIKRIVKKRLTKTIITIINPK